MAKIPWSRIREAFDGEWVELIDCAWRSSSLQPAAGKVRFHNKSRTALLAQIKAAGRQDGAVILFVGPSLPAVQMHDGLYEFSVSAS
jgi:hypothetical protein